ncbi:unnamed protein product, partial [Meganyctiphanes norvegica]
DAAATATTAAVVPTPPTHHLGAWAGLELQHQQQQQFYIVKKALHALIELSIVLGLIILQEIQSAMACVRPSVEAVMGVWQRHLGDRRPFCVHHRISWYVWKFGKPYLWYQTTRLVFSLVKRMKMWTLRTWNGILSV